MPKKTTKSKAKKPSGKNKPAKSSSGHTYNIQGGIHAKGVVMGNQTNYHYQTEQILNITSLSQFVDELQKLKAEIERMKSLPGVDPAAARRMDAARADIQDAIIEAEKAEPAAQRINSTLDGAKETMEKLGSDITSAVNLGTTLGNLALLALKLFGG